MKKISTSLAFLCLYIATIISCSEQVDPLANSVFVDGKKYSFDPADQGQAEVTFGEIYISGDECPSKYLQIELRGNGNLESWNLSLIGPGIGNELALGEYAVSEGCYGAINFVHFNSAQYETYACQQWSLLGGWGTGACQRQVSSFDATFQKDQHFNMLEGNGFLKILELNTANQQIAIEFEIIANFNTQGANQISTISGNYKGTYNLGGYDKPSIPNWAVHGSNYHKPMDTCAMFFGYPVSPPKPVLKQTIEVHINGSDNSYAKCTIEMFDQRASNCYNNTITFNNDFVVTLSQSNSNLDQATYALENKTVNFNLLPGNKIEIVYPLRNLALNQYYIIGIRTSPNVKDMFIGENPSPIDLQTASLFKVTTEPYICTNSDGGITWSTPFQCN